MVNFLMQTQNAVLGKTLRFLTFLAHSSEMLDVLQKWHFQYISWANLESK